ncbi:hypothetical protein OEA41_000730 [Lepraria neglecta]|uniref:BTB domain-containing protein n=1 Tax=Lepraria neglecta TaxID=209136 RepID=A0AAD9ZH52_9LECA|nr:hypothetical protein OEA41_000730 [Lepraria neglecta]
MARHYDKKVSLDNVNFMTGTDDVCTIEGKRLYSQSEFFEYCFLANTPSSQMETVILSMLELKDVDIVRVVLQWLHSKLKNDKALYERDKEMTDYDWCEVWKLADELGTAKVKDHIVGAMKARYWAKKISVTAVTLDYERNIKSRPGQPGLWELLKKCILELEHERSLIDRNTDRTD